MHNIEYVKMYPKIRAVSSRSLRVCGSTEDSVFILRTLRYILTFNCSYSHLHNSTLYAKPLRLCGMGVVSSLEFQIPIPCAGLAGPWVRIMVRPMFRLCALFRPHICWLRWSVLSSPLPDRQSDYRYRCMTYLNLYEMRCVDVDLMPQIPAPSALFLSIRVQIDLFACCSIRAFERCAIPTNRLMGLVG